MAAPQLIEVGVGASDAGSRPARIRRSLRHFAISENVLMSSTMRRPNRSSLCVLAAAVALVASASAADSSKPENNTLSGGGPRGPVGVGKIDVLTVVSDEAVRRQETTGVMKRTLARAEASRKQKNFWAAAVLYEATLAHSRQLGGVNVDVETRRAIAGLTTSRLGLAKAANKQWDFAAADQHMARLLDLDPKNKKALEYRAYNRAVAKAHKGRTPSIEVRKRAAAHVAQKKEVDTLVQDGKFLYEMRMLGEAKSKLKQAIQQDPSHRAAYYYLSLIQEAQYGDAARKRDLMQKERLVEVEREWNELLK